MTPTDISQAELIELQQHLPDILCGIKPQKGGRPLHGIFLTKNSPVEARVALNMLRVLRWAFTSQMEVTER